MDFWGYKLAPTYNELTVEQALFLDMGRTKLEEKRNGNDKQLKKMNGVKRR